MSLDERTLDWLKKRATESCESCRTFCEITRNICSRDPKPKALAANFFSLSGCDLAANWQDCAEFEARVAATLTDKPPYAFGFCSLCKYNTHGCRDLTMPLKQCLIKHARLAVEAEMEKEGK